MQLVYYGITLLLDTMSKGHQTPRLPPISCQAELFEGICGSATPSRITGYTEKCEETARSQSSRGETISRNLNHRDRELLMSKLKRAEATQREWEEVQEAERDRKKEILERRVKTQRKLIQKTDLLSKQLWHMAEQRKLQEMEDRRKIRSDTTASLRAHIQRIEEHKRRIAAKLATIATEDDDSTASTPHAEAEGCAPFNDQGPADGCSREPKNANDKDGVPADFLNLPDSTKAINVVEVWDELRAKSARKLEVIAAYSDALKKKISSPSARLCLDIYEQPTAHNPSSGKPVLLTELLRQSCNKEQSTRALHTGLLATTIRLNEQKAQYMLSKKDYPGSFQETGLGWYGLVPLQPPLVGDKTGNAELVPLPHTNTLVQTTFGNGNSNVTNQKSTTFVTDIQTENAIVPKRTTRSAGWQPLSQTALLEYSTVRELPIHGNGDLEHGRYRMWRPI